MKTAIAVAISVCLSLALLSGIESLHKFAFYVCFVMNGLAWLGLLVGLDEDTKASIRKTTLIKTASTAFSLYSLISTGHPMLAASSFVCSALIVATVFAPTKRKAV